MDADQEPRVAVAGDDVTHKQGRKHSQPWCLTHDAPMVCSAPGAPPGLRFEVLMSCLKTNGLIHGTVVDCEWDDLVEAIGIAMTSDTVVLTESPVPGSDEDIQESGFRE